VNSRYGYRE